MFDNYIKTFKLSTDYAMSKISTYSLGMSVVMADRQIKRSLDEGKITIEEIGDAKVIIKDKYTGKWFMMSGGQ